MGKIGLKAPYLRQHTSGFYWEPSRKLRMLGFCPEALGADPVAALKRAREINQQVAKAISRDTAEPLAIAAEGTVAWAIRQFQASNSWRELQPSTHRGYQQGLDRVEAWCGDKRIEQVTRKAVKIWQAALEQRAPAMAAAVLRVFRIVMHFARDQGYRIDNFDKLRLHTSGGEAEPWADHEISAYVDEAKRQGRQSMALALMLGVCLGQRQGDILRLPRSSYDAGAGTITLRQHKTGKPLALPVLPELAREIAVTPLASTIFVASEKSGKPYKPRYFAQLHREICQAAGIPDARWFLHLRHTAATRLGEAGYSQDLIRAVTGHASLAVVQRYVRPTETMARAAITKLQEHRNRKDGT
jgi:integrase